jgi:2-polyprenyl-6-hydroxyphenyl methylase/3-demethylubiquinone-9 3-methyltransferase
VVGIDQSVNALEMARQEDSTQQVSYQLGDIRKLTQESHSFDVVCAMDVLEHVTPFECVIAEASRILRPQGLFFFYTFNRNFLSWVLAVKGLEWFVKNTPKNLHVYSMFIKPTELSESMDKHHLKTAKMLGLRPEICSLNFIKLIFSGTVPESFRFKLTPSLAVGYLGVAIKSVDQSEYPL